MGYWDGIGLWGGDVAQVRARLAAGADPCVLLGGGHQTMLHSAAGFASPEVVEAMAGAARTLDMLVDGRSALWVMSTRRVRPREQRSCARRASR